MSETRTEYAIEGTIYRHGELRMAIETIPGHESDEAWNRRVADEQREAQAAAGLTPDARVVVRIWTATDWM